MAQTRMPLKVELADGESFEVTADMRDMRLWERNNKGKSFIEEPIDLGRMNYVAWSAARRNGLTTMSAKDFDLNVVSLDQLDEDDELIEVDGELVDPTEVPPTPPTPGDVSSSPSL
ncbi:hypothetical protein [uncultured Aeromicrobium sp.]|uniref:hypothetical protein n=1 Tax=uncultured Aeromicrobium sp. TaxID=337820 RepID=UPI0025F6490E|nr:hypothetical protein [uncultured Aeromicrobium sp.]